MPAQLNKLTAQLLFAIRRLADAGLCPATGGNFSVRVDDQQRLITRSGKDKRRIQARDLMLCDVNGQALEANAQPSDETALHMRLYALDPDIACVLHTHSGPATVLSRATPGEALSIQGYEMQKALAGQASHSGEIHVPIMDNSQDISGLADELSGRWPVLAKDGIPGLLVRGHGVYAWGRSVDEALRHAEGLEFLLNCRLQERLLERNA